MQTNMQLHGGTVTSPAGPWPKVCPPMVLCSGLKPNSSVGTPNDANLAS